ncbi:hypothetical protein MMYC01_206081 [Madurella mycetomatis]|uniref:Uncharacterized protein n=1 Tax=Madurella mycetomatis TaxID=100816 RepID=A0A175W1D4_9PEZI|nr:hypothetical protein MMYC01_206081 [Madurella mycetomatis]
MEDTSARVSNGSYEAGLQRTIRELEGMKMELEAALDQLRASAGNHVPDGGISAKDTLEIMTRAFKDEAESEPLLPPPGSALPALLAMRRTHQIISESNEYTDSRAASVEQIERQIEAERANLREQQALQVALENRIKSLREGLEDRQEKTEEQIAKERIVELKQEKDHWDKQTSSLMKQLDWFIGEHLGPMLAAEELGGPVVGDLTEVDPDDLTAGFSAHGKPKKAKDRPDQDKRQRRIDDIWGPQEQPDQANKRKRDRDEASAASAEMRDLTEQLMNKLMESGGDHSAAYVEIAKESAAVRFLVRSKVAVFHPKDARKLRLVDFGREVDD